MAASPTLPPPTAVSEQARLVRSLQNSACYPHPVTEVSLIETHISWVLLAGDYVYKLKKNVNFGFLDFSTLAKRRHCCEEELRLNSRQAKDLYLAVVPISGTPETPVLGGNGEAFEYAVKMRRFPQGALLDQRLARGELHADAIDLLANTLVAFHQGIATASRNDNHNQDDRSNDNYGNLDQITCYTQENCKVLAPLLHDPVDQQRLAFYTAWIERQHQQLAPLFATRKQQGFIRECHGDLHLRNITLENGKIHFFDCIEFNPALRWIDVISELAFLAMDLYAAGQARYSHRLINRYLELTGDYAGVPLLRYYLAYRAMVRAKVALLRLPQATTPQEKATLMHSGSDYLQLACRYASEHAPALVMTHGLSGSGKSTRTQALLELLGAIRLRSDVERKRHQGMPPVTPAHTGMNDGANSGIYSADATRATYATLAEYAETIMDAGFPVIIDATCLKRWQRELFQTLAQRKGVRFAMVDFPVGTLELERRIAYRQAHEHDASDATLQVLHQQIATQEPLSDAERACTFVQMPATLPDAARENNPRDSNPRENKKPVNRQGEDNGWQPLLHFLRDSDASP